jgi:hypothetical protein
MLSLHGHASSPCLEFLSGSMTCIERLARTTSPAMCQNALPAPWWKPAAPDTASTNGAMPKLCDHTSHAMRGPSVKATAMNPRSQMPMRHARVSSPWPVPGRQLLSQPASSQLACPPQRSWPSDYVQVGLQSQDSGCQRAAKHADATASSAAVCGPACGPLQMHAVRFVRCATCRRVLLTRSSCLALQHHIDPIPDCHDHSDDDTHFNPW